MIDTIEQVSCKACGKPLTQRPGKGHRQREYCNATCRQRAHRAKGKPSISHNVTLVTINEKQQLEQRIAQLEQEVETLKALRRKRSSPDVQARHAWQYRAMERGYKLSYPSLDFQVRVKAGEKAWQSFIKEAGEDTLIRLVMAAEEISKRDKRDI